MCSVRGEHTNEEIEAEKRSIALHKPVVIGREALGKAVEGTHRRCSG